MPWYEPLDIPEDSSGQAGREAAAGSPCVPGTPATAAGKLDGQQAPGTDASLPGEAGRSQSRQNQAAVLAGHLLGACTPQIWS